MKCDEAQKRCFEDQQRYNPVQRFTREGVHTQGNRNLAADEQGHDTSCHERPQQRVGKSRQAQSKLVPSQHVHGSHQQGSKHERQEVQLIAQEHHESPDSPCDLDQHQASKSQRNWCVNPQHLRQRH